jgi:predicted ATP-grasp superfamily ATP-dependent carboligase
LQWVGLFELELIEYGPDTYGAIDFNPRPYGSLSLASRAGVPLTSLWCDWLLGERVAEPRHARVGTPYRWEDADLTHLVSRLRDGSLRSALAVAKPHRGVAHAYFRIRDPAPLVARAAQIVVNTAVRARPFRRGPVEGGGIRSV